MTCNITNTPFIPEPLPLYQPRARDPETASLLSAAPSYRSEAPTYVSRRQSFQLQNPASNTVTSLIPPDSSGTPHRGGLPATQYAEGFQSRAHGSVADLNHYNFNMSHWSNINSSHNSRQYQNVAARRANRAVASASPLFSSLMDEPPPEAESSRAAQPSSSHTFPANVDLRNTGEPLNPLEDPYLVGESAARQARTRRIYREMCMRGEEAIRHEGKSWDFLLAQMADWEERERSWTKFRHEVNTGRRKLLGRRIGMKY